MVGAKLSVALEGDQPAALYLEALGIAERAGLFSLQLYEHLGHRPAWATSFLLAPHTRRVRVGPVTVPSALTHPLYLATQALYLDEVSGGRALLGVSRGAYYERMGGLGVSKFEALRDTLEILGIVFLRSGRGHHGKVFSLPEGVGPLFGHAGRPTLYAGTSGPKTLRMVSSNPLVDGVVVDNLWNPTYVAVVLENVAQGAAMGGRTSRPEIVARPFCVVFEREEERPLARRLAENRLAEYLPSLVDGSPMLGYAKIGREELERFSRAPHADAELSQRIIENFCAFGTPDEIVEQAHRMLRSGVDHICFGLPLGPDPLFSLRLLAQKVVPQLAAK